MNEKLAICPCGQTPSKLYISPTETTKYALVYAGYCTEWLLEFRTGYKKLDSPECMELAIKKWNEAPRNLQGN